MKFTKKLFVGIVALALLVSCFAMVASAESGFTEANIEDILEYYNYTEYLSEDFEDAEVDAKYDLSMGAEAHNVSAYYGPNASKVTVVEIGENKVLRADKLIPGTTNPTVIDLSDMCEGKDLVATFDYMTNALGNATQGYEFGLVLEMHNAKNDTTAYRTVMMMDMSSTDNSEWGVEFFTYDEASGEYVTKKLGGLSPALGKWYQFELIFDFNAGSYTVSVSEDGAAPVSATYSLGTNDLVLSANFVMGSDAIEGNAYLDNVHVYEGSYIRHLTTKNDATAEAILNLKALAESDTITLENKIRIADVLAEVLIEEEYSPLEGTEKYDDVVAAIAEFRNFINKTYVDALVTYTADIDVSKNYYERMDQVAKIDSFDVLVPADEAELEVLPGLNETDVENVNKARESLAAEKAALLEIKEASEAFIEAVMLYDAENKDYQYIKSTYEAIKVIDKRDSVYKYTLKPGEEVAIYATVADAEVVFNSLGVKKAEIEAVTVKFYSLVAQMDVAEAAVKFGDYYNAYCEAIKVYNNGTLHVGLDNATINTADLVMLDADFESEYDSLAAAIESYLVHKVYVDGRVELCEQFIEYVERANNSTYYATKKALLALAWAYIDEDEGTADLTVELEYPGVTDRITLYNTILASIEKNGTDSVAYVAAVNAIETATGYAAKKAAVEKALALKLSGDILGLPDVVEANVKLAKAEAEIATLEGYAKTLIASVANLKAATSLADARTYIAIAKDAESKCEASIAGVADAKADLAAEIAAYDAKIAAANANFSTAMKNAADISAALANSSKIYKLADLTKALIK